MSRIIQIENHGPIITATNYWTLPPIPGERSYVSVNAGAFRVLLRPEAEAEIPDMRAARECLVSRGPWRPMGLVDALEILFDDHSPNPYAQFAQIESIDRLPLDSDQDKEWTLSVWINRRGQPREVLTRPCWYRRVPQIPYLKPKGA